MRQLFASTMPRCVCLLCAFLFLFCISSVAALTAENGLVIDEQYDFAQKGGVPIPEKKLTQAEIDAAEAVCTKGISAKYNYDVPLYGQCWSPWAYYQLGFCSGVSICDAGCAMCSSAMILAFYGVNANPANLNEYLKANGGYYSGCNIYWAPVAGMSGGSVTWVASYDWTYVAADLNVVNAQLDAGYPLICETRYNGGMHFVVITGRDGATYYINDPGFGDKTTLNARYGSPAQAIYGIRVYHGSVYSNPPYLFTSGADGWAPGNSIWSNGLAHTGSAWNGSIYFDQTGPDCFIFSPTTSFTGASPQVLNVDFYPQNGTGTGHDMQLHWITSAEGSFSADKATPLTFYQGRNEWRSVNLYINNAKWTGKTIKQLRLDFDNNNQSTRYIVNHVVLQNALYWPFSSDVGGWTAGNSLTTPWHTASGWPGCLVTDQTGNDAYMFSPTISGSGFPFNYLGGVNDWIKLRIYPQNGTTSAHDLRVYWTHSSDTTWSDTKSVPVTYNGKNGWVDVYVPVGQSPHWERQHITRLRVDFDQVNQGTRWIVDEISCLQLGNDSTAPTVPTGLNATATGGNTVELTWTASTDATGVNGYKIFRNGTQIATSISPSYRDSSCQPQTTYSYTVSAYDAVGNNSAQSAAKSVTTPAPDTQAPSVPANLRRTAVTKSSITIAWDASTDNVAVAGYRIYRNGAQVGTATGTSYTDSGLSANTGYTYQVDAYDARPNYSARSLPFDTGTGGTWTQSNALFTCYVRSGSPDICGQGGIAVGFSSTASLQIRRGLVQWDMTGAPTTAEAFDTADSVRIKLYQYTQFSATTPADISLYKVNNDWNETNGTWNNVGIGAKYAGATTTCVGVGDYLWKYNGRTQGVPPANRGVYIKNDTNESDAACAKVFESRINSGGSGNLPRLEIDYVDLTPPVNCSIKINNGAASTDSTAVTLTLAATDYLSGMSHMQFSNDGVSYSAAEPYATSKSYTLSSGDGTKAVYVRFRDKVGNWSAPVSASIVLNTVVHIPSYGMSNKAAWDAIISNVSPNTAFTLWGRVTQPIDANSFFVDDGSSMPIKINYTGHGFTTADYISATGLLDTSGAVPVLNALAVKKQN
ncbi:MAG: DNRLRE domain-containing protein [Armatimonadota bacterium]